MPELLHLQETFINQTLNAQFGESPVYETHTDNVGKLFRYLQSEYGRCRGNVYIDKADGSTAKVGWTFEKRMRYEDARRDDNGRYPESAYYVREVWCTLHNAPPSRTVQYHYFDLNGKKNRK